jgi:hypothetical protein
VSNFAADFEASFLKLKELSLDADETDDLSRSDAVLSVFKHRRRPDALALQSRSAAPLEGRARYTASEPLRSGLSEELELDSRYKIQYGARGFFTVGRVFAMLWHTNFGSSARQIQQDQNNHRASSMIQIGRFDERVMSYIQRMAVVKEGRGFCWCIPVNTYNGKGVSNRRFNDSDRAAHAIICMKDQTPFLADDERGISKREIMVIPAGPDQKLDPMSRLNFGKVHTVEHNVKVMNVGQVDARSLRYFEAYWEASAKESFRGKRDDRTLALTST